MALGLGLAVLVSPALAQAESKAPACYETGGGALEVCRSESEPEGVYFTPPPCQYALGVQILHLDTRAPPGPLQVLYHGEPRGEPSRASRKRGGEDDGCAASLRADDPSVGGSLRSGRQHDQLALTMPDSAYRFWPRQADNEPRRRLSRSERREQARKPAEIRTRPPGEEDAGGRAPMTVAGRDWAGDDYFYIFMIATEAIDQNRRHVLIQGRTYDFEGFDLRAHETDSDAVDWQRFSTPETSDDRGRQRGRRRPADAGRLSLAPVIDESGRPITGNCAAPGFEARGLVGSISVVDQVYHYFYTDVLPSDCNEPAPKRRMALYLRTSKDLTTDKTWSVPQIVVEGLPADTLMRVGKARGMERWAVAYTCHRPASASGGPVEDLCLHYSADLTIDSIKALRFFSEPASAARSTAYLGLRSGGDGSGRYGRDGFFWMTDRYGNLDAPGIYPSKGGLLTWLDRRAPRADGAATSSLYGRPVYWSTWTVRTR